jgi:hypothetical protein
MPTSAKGEPFYRDAAGNRQDADFHNPILEDGDDEAALVPTRVFLKSLGFTDAEIEEGWGVPKRVHKLEDRILSLRDQADQLDKAFNPSQPRANDGKWTDGDGSAAKWKGWVMAGLATAGTVGVIAGTAYLGHKTILNSISREFRALGIDPSMVRVNYDSKGTPAGLLGRADYARRQVNFWPTRLLYSPRTVASVAAHEGTHIKFDEALARSKGLKEWLIANMASLGDEAIGVSSYSDKFWQRLGESMRTSPNTKLMHQVYLVDAVHETLAEMSDKQRRTGKLPGGSLLQKLYADHVLPKRGGNFVMVTT